MNSTPHQAADNPLSPWEEQFLHLLPNCFIRQRVKCQQSSFQELRGTSPIGFSSLWLLASWLSPFFLHLLLLLPFRIPNSAPGFPDTVRTHPWVSMGQPHSTQHGHLPPRTDCPSGALGWFPSLPEIGWKPKLTFGRLKSWMTDSPRSRSRFLPQEKPRSGTTLPSPCPCQAADTTPNSSWGEGGSLVGALIAIGPQLSL